MNRTGRFHPDKTLIQPLVPVDEFLCVNAQLVQILVWF
jgi:hypothetical protein